MTPMYVKLPRMELNSDVARPASTDITRWPKTSLVSFYQDA